MAMENSDLPPGCTPEMLPEEPELVPCKCCNGTGKVEKPKQELS